jgi:alcohol dehydrogenase class IV
MQPFTLEVPPAIVFGAGVHARLPEFARRFGRRLLLCKGSGWFDKSPWKQRFADLLAEFEVTPLQMPPGEPSSEALEPLLAAARSLEPNLIVAVGGGSVLDSAKALAGLLPHHGRVEQYLEGVGEGLAIPGPGTPWIALPTTAGTGAEATKNAVVRARRLGYKRSLRSPFLLASCVLVDPELSLHCPPSLTGISGMDALTQLVESFVTRKANPVARALARQAFPVMLSALKALAGRPDDLQARADAAYGALVSGITLANAGLGAAHGFASGLGGMYEVPHGLICALFLPPVLRFNAEVIRADCELLRRSAAEYSSAKAGGEEGPAGADPVEWLLGELDKLFERYGLPGNLKAFGIRREDVPEIARRSSGSSMSGNPKELPLEERARMLASLL